jgi:hypothetical protein
LLITVARVVSLQVYLEMTCHDNYDPLFLVDTFQLQE